MIVHTPVMLEEIKAVLAPDHEEALMVDCTLGEGGHAESFLATWPTLRYIGIDTDSRIQAKARARLAPFGDRISLRIGWFDEVLASLAAEIAAGKGPEVDLILFDLGISMYHYLESGRGFSFGKDEPLDMRLSPEAPRSAADIVNGDREENLANIIYQYGEERFSRRIARAIVEARRIAPIATSARLEEIVFLSVPQSYRHGRIHPATRTFQALRIATNDELGRAWRGIATAASILAPGGKMAVIAFHSLEDRIAKTLFKVIAGRGESSSLPVELWPIIETMKDSHRFDLPFRKPQEPGDAEIAANPASRSAKLRVLTRRREAAEEAS